MELPQGVWAIHWPRHDTDYRCCLVWEALTLGLTTTLAFDLVIFLLISFGHLKNSAIAQMFLVKQNVIIIIVTNL